MTKELEIRLDGVIEGNNGREFTRLVGGFGKDKPVISDLQVAELLGYSKGARQVRVQIESNRKSFEDCDIIDIKDSVQDRDAMLNMLIPLGYTRQAVDLSKNIYIFSQSGFLLYLKFAEGDKAVGLYKNFIEDYFKTKVENEIMEGTIQEQIKEWRKQRGVVYGQMIVSEDENERFELAQRLEEIIEIVTKLEGTLEKENLIEKLQPKLHFADKIEDTNGCYDMHKFAKMIEVENMGRNNLFKWLRERKVLVNNPPL